MTHPFTHMLRHLRHYEELMLYANLLQPADSDRHAAIAYLEEEYAKECIDYPSVAPSFDAAAAAYGAITLYTATQLLMYRQHRVEDLALLIPAYEGPMEPAAHLSADLTLRFLPDVLRHLQAIDPGDALIPLLENILLRFHYSGIGWTQKSLPQEIGICTADPCLFQLYTDRIIFYKHRQLAAHPLFSGAVQGSLGLFANHFWKELETATT